MQVKLSPKFKNFEEVFGKHIEILWIFIFRILIIEKELRIYQGCVAERFLRCVIKKKIGEEITDMFLGAERNMLRTMLA